MIAALPEYQFTVQTLPARYFSWRFRGNPLSWLELDLDPLPDAIIATSMTDIATLKGLHSGLQDVPTMLYFHENQFAYPDSHDATHLVDRQLTSLYSSLAADRLVFNSDYNRQTFLMGVDDLIKRFPDGVPAGIVQRLETASLVCPVPLDDNWFDQTEETDSPGQLNVVWNHRWEHDKGPDLLLEIVERLLITCVPFMMHLLGQRYRQVPETMTKVLELLAENGKLASSEFVESRDDYQQVLASADIVLSTSGHEFQGLAVLEAAAMGCRPLVPDRLVYPELYPLDFRYASADEAVAKLVLWQESMPTAPDMSQFAWRAQAPVYGRLINELIAEQGNSTIR